MASAPLNWLLKIGDTALKTTAQTLSEAVNWLYDKVTALDATVETKADISEISSLTQDKLNISDLLDLEEIAASTDLTNKGAAAEAVKEVNDRLQADNGQTFQFAYDSASGKYGYKKKEADSEEFVPFKTTEVVYLGSGTSFNVSAYKGYQNFTANNFIVQMNNLNGWNSQYNSDISGSGNYYWSKVTISLAKSYNASTGVLTAYYGITNNYGAHMASPPSTSSSGTIAVSAWLVLN